MASIVHAQRHMQRHPVDAIEQAVGKQQRLQQAAAAAAAAARNNRQQEAEVEAEEEGERQAAAAATQGGGEEQPLADRFRPPAQRRVSSIYSERQ